MAAKGILSLTLKIILKMYYPLPVSPHSEILSRSTSLPCTEPESSGDDRIESDSLGAQADGREEELSEIPIAGEPDDMTGKHRDGKKIPLKRAQFSGEGNVVPQAFISSSEIPIDLQGTGRTCRTPSCDATNCCGQRFVRGSGENFLFSSRRRGDPRNNTTSDRSSSCETADEPATARDDRRE